MQPHSHAIFIVIVDYFNTNGGFFYGKKILVTLKMKEKINSLQKNETWIIVEKPED